MERMSEDASPEHEPASAAIDRAEFGARFEACAHTLWYVAFGIVGNRSLAEDIVQEAVVTGLSRLTQFDPATSFQAWMSQIVRYTALNAARKEQHRRSSASAVAPDQVAAQPAHLADDVNSMADARGGSEFDDDVQAALAQLNPQQRACLLLRTVKGMSYKEIATALDVPEGTAMSHVHRARAQLRDALSDAGEQLK